MYDNLEKGGAVVWLTGLSGSGKTTVADGIYTELSKRGLVCDRLDGDEIRKNINKELDFSEAGRKRNIRIAGFVAARLASHAVLVLCSFISPYRSQRNELKTKIDNFIEIFVSAPIEVCEDRDVKGLYAKARAGEIKNFTGIDNPYEEPDNPDLILYTHQESEEESIGKVIKFLEDNKYI